MGLMADHIDDDLKKGISVEDCLLRLGGYIDAWIAGHEQHIKLIEARLDRLEAVAKTDKQTIDEVDSSVRQSWEALDQRVSALERGE